MDPVQRQVYEHCAADLLQAKSRRERGEIVRRAAGVLGVSKNTVWRHLQEVGWDSGREERCDKGRSVVGTEDLRVVASIVASNINKRGQPNTPQTEAWRIAQEMGLPAGSISSSHLSRRLREEGLGITQMRAAEGSCTIVSDYPNHAWYEDPSVAIQWYFRDEQGKLLSQYDDPEARFYAGKVENYKALRRILYRYCVVDHFSSAFYVQYFYSTGERFEDVADFLFQSMSDKGLGDVYPFRGIPKHLFADQGPAFKNSLIQTLCGKMGLGITVHMHLPKNAKANGKVEKFHDIWQRLFEGRLRLAGSAKDLEELNRLALQWCAKINATRPFTRHGETRMAVWSRITSEQLVECPKRSVFFQLVASSPIDATLDSHHWVRHNNRRWLLRGKNLYTGQKVEIKETPFSDVGIRAWDKQGQELAAEEINFDPVSGFPMNGRIYHIDDPEARGATTPATAAQQILKDVKSGKLVVSIPSALDTGPLPSFLTPREGRAWTPPENQVLYTEPLIGSIDAREEIAQRLNRPLGEDGAWWRERIGDGVTRQQLEELWNEFITPAEAGSTAKVG